MLTTILDRFPGPPVARPHVARLLKGQPPRLLSHRDLRGPRCGSAGQWGRVRIRGTPYRPRLLLLLLQLCLLCILYLSYYVFHPLTDCSLPARLTLLALPAHPSRNMS